MRERVMQKKQRAFIHRFLRDSLQTVASLLILACLSKLAVAVDDEQSVSFESKIAPVLIQRCVECHNHREASGGLDLTTSDGLHQGGDSGKILEAGEPERSDLLQRVLDHEMPPEKRGQKQPLPDEEIKRLRTWIAEGAYWPKDRTLDLFERTTSIHAGRDWWSLLPVSRPEIPAVKNTEWIINPIDRFILSRLKENGYEPAPRADKRVIIRRVYFDVIGLPPSSKQIESFLADNSPAAYEKMVDQLLASLHFGERWTRYWLDLVRYGDTCGYERDQVKPNVWKYRDWVIESINNDKPYDRFVIEQLAGDELPNRSENNVIATGFLRLGTWNDEPNDQHEYQYERLEDMVHVTSSTFLGMTVKCARCHEHKFDPIEQEDYYRMASTFWAGFIAPGSGKLLGGPDKTQLGYDVFGWTDRSRDPPPLHLLIKGDPKRLGKVIAPAQLSMVTYLKQTISPPPEESTTSQRRLQLAQWIASPKNPLTARVYVNRIWQHHFGYGLVRSPNNFGFTGDQPTHPKLLDWLADELIRGGWKTKRLHKMMLMSQTYRQASVHPRGLEYSERDFNNRLLWRANRRRLDAEALRDSMLAVSGRLNMKAGGPGFRPSVVPAALEGLSRKGSAWKASAPEEQNRRSIYIFSQRSLLVPLMTAFDFPETTLPCGKRDITTVAPQALALLNNDFVHQQSRALAKQVAKQAGAPVANRIKTAWQLSLSRQPSETEFKSSLQHIDSQKTLFTNVKNTNTNTNTKSPDLLALASLCHVLLNSNEFIYID